MATFTSDAVALFAALAGGEDSPENLCPIIADALNDAGNDLAPVVRLVLPGALRWLAPEGSPVLCPLLGSWLPGSAEWVGLHFLPPEPSGRHCYHTPAAAYLSLAEALAPLLPYHDRRPSSTGLDWHWFMRAEIDTPDWPSRLPASLYKHCARPYPTEQAAMLALLAVPSNPPAPVR